MVVANDERDRRPALADLKPAYFDPDCIVCPPDNAEEISAVVEALDASWEKFGQLMPAFVCTMPELLPHQRWLLDGRHRLAVARRRREKLWAFDLGRPMSEIERIEFICHNHLCRRVMSREEIAERAAQYMDLRKCTAGEAARFLNISGSTLSRIFGFRRIPPELQVKTELLVESVRGVIAATPSAHMARVVEFATTPGPDGKLPTRDAVAAFVKSLKAGDKPAAKVKSVALHCGNRVVTIQVTATDNTATVSKDLQAIVARLGKHAEVPPNGWPFLFQGKP